MPITGKISESHLYLGTNVIWTNEGEFDGRWVSYIFNLDSPSGGVYKLNLGTDVLRCEGLQVRGVNNK